MNFLTMWVLDPLVEHLPLEHKQLVEAGFDYHKNGQLGWKKDKGEELGIVVCAVSIVLASFHVSSALSKTLLCRIGIFYI